MKIRKSILFEGQVWKVIPVPFTTCCVVETKLAATRQTSVALVDLQKGAAVWEKVLEGMEWWSTVVGVSDQLLLVHNFRNPEVPEPSDLLAYSLEQGELEWVKPGFRLLSVTTNGLIAEIGKRVGEGLELSSIAISTTSIKERDSEMKVVLPTRYMFGESYFNVMEEFIRRYGVLGEIKQIEYLEQVPYLVFSYYIYKEDTLMQFLLIVDQSKQLLYHSAIGEVGTKVGRDTLYLQEGYVVFVSQKNELVSLKLPN